jgi:sugar-specific transcriptional regulator TrmB
MASISEATVMKRVVSELKELELTTHEALVYTALLTHPNTTASTLCKETSIPDSKIYYALDGLVKKGMAIVQEGNPSIYLPIPPREAIKNLKHQLTGRLNQKLKEADGLAEQLAPIYDRAEKPEELELAYIIRGQRNIANRMKTLIEAAKREITVFIPNKSILEEIRASLIKAKTKRRVKLNIAVTPEVYAGEDFSDLGEVRVLCCVLGLLISDMKMLLTVSNWSDEVAVLTQDPNLMRVCRDYYDNPVCCRPTKR